MLIFFSGFFSGLFSEFSGFSLNFQFSLHNMRCTSHISYNYFLFRKFIRFSDIFPEFFRIFIKSSDLFFPLLLCSRSRTLSISVLLCKYNRNYKLQTVLFSLIFWKFKRWETTLFLLKIKFPFIALVAKYSFKNGNILMQNSVKTVCERWRAIFSHLRTYFKGKCFYFKLWLEVKAIDCQNMRARHSLRSISSQRNRHAHKLSI